MPPTILKFGVFLTGFIEMLGQVLLVCLVQVKEKGIKAKDLKVFIVAFKVFVFHKCLHKREQAGVVEAPFNAEQQKLFQRRPEDFQFAQVLREVACHVVEVEELLFINGITGLPPFGSSVLVQLLALQEIPDSLVFNEGNEVGDPDVAAEGKADLDALADPLFQDFKIG